MFSSHSTLKTRVEGEYRAEIRQKNRYGDDAFHFFLKRSSGFAMFVVPIGFECDITCLARRFGPWISLSKKQKKMRGMKTLSSGKELADDLFGADTSHLKLACRWPSGILGEPFANPGIGEGGGGGFGISPPLP